MPFASGYQNDIFVSYAHVDDDPAIGNEGWVTTLVRKLQKCLAQKLGRDAAKIWMDYQLRTNDQVTPALIHAIDESALLLVILSPGYIASPWCQQEAAAFREVLRKRKASGHASRIFVVERDKVDRTEWPQDFEQLRSISFWEEDKLKNTCMILGEPQPDPAQKAYWAQVHALCSDLKTELKELSASQTPSAAQTTTPSAEVTEPAVVLAETTDDLHTLRSEVRRYLLQAGLRVLPIGDYPWNPEELRRAIDLDLAKAKLFVQLLSAAPGRKPADFPEGAIAFQFARAQAARREILQWRPPDLDVEKVEDPQYRLLLQGADVLSMPYEQFKARIVERARAEPPPPARKRDSDGHFILLNYEPSDNETAAAIKSVLTERGFGFGELEARGLKKKYEEILDYLHRSDGFVYVYDKCPAEWVSGQQKVVFKLLPKLERTHPVLGIYEGPPDPKPPLQFRLPSLRLINCRKGFDVQKLHEFLDSIAQRPENGSGH